MNAADIINAIDQILEVGDTLDNAGIGAKALTEGKNTTRQVCRLELGQFLLYIADGAYEITDAQTSLLNIVMVGLGSSISTQQFKQMANEVGEPKPMANLSFETFCRADLVMAQQSNSTNTTCTDMLITMYEYLGQLMVAFNQNVVSQMRYDRLMQQFRQRVSSLKEMLGSASTPISSGKTVPDEKKDASPSEKKISDSGKKTSGTNGAVEDVVRFELPSDYRMVRETKDDGTEICKIVSGESRDDAGNTVYRFAGTVRNDTVEDTDDDIIPSGEKPLETIHRRDPNRQLLRISEDPEAEYHLIKTPLNFLGRTVNICTIALVIPTEGRKYMALMNTNQYDEEKPDDFQQSCEDMLAMARAARVNGKPLRLGGLSVAQMIEALTPDFDNAGGTSSGINLSVGLQVKHGDTVISSGTMTGNAEGGVDYVEKYRDVDPADELYQHYGKLKREHDKWSGLGVVHVQNNGLEFQAIDVMEHLERNWPKEEPLYKTLSDAEENDSYTLDDTALRLAQVFRVNKDSFDKRHDAEGEISEGLIDKKWKLSALRSFAWTLADMADREKKSIDDYDYGELLELCSYIEGREWLNYEGGSWFDGLCGQPDIHVFYVPDAVIQAGQQEDLHRMMCFAPVFSLEALRSDLGQLENVMKRLYNGLLKDRDRSEPLDSPSAAVLYAWCAMAVAARAPFFSEDGPMFYYHEYPTVTLYDSEVAVGPGKAKPKKAVPKPKKAEPSAAMSSAERYEIVKGEDGKERVRFGEYPKGEPIIWLVMEKKDGCVTLLSEFGLDAQPFFDYQYGGTNNFNSTNQWEDTTLRKWLNNEFCNTAFDASEQNMIQLTELENYNKTQQGEELCKSTEDKVYLLSAKELKDLFPKDRDRICKATAYARQRGAEIEAGPDQCHWWLRCPGVSLGAMSGWVGRVSADSSVKGWGSSDEKVCVRPVIRVKADALKTGMAQTPSRDTASAKAEAPQTDFTSYLSHDEIMFKDKTFAFVGITIEYGDMLYDRLCMAGGLPRQDVNSKTNYLVVKDPNSKASGKLKKAIDLIGKGQDLKIILLKDFDAALDAAGATEAVLREKKEREAKARRREQEEKEREANKDCLLDLGGATVIEQNQFAFGKLSSQGKVIIPDGVTAIEQSAFYLTKMREVKLPTTLKRIADYAFGYCDNLEKIEIEEGIEEIGFYAFVRCPKLLKLTLPDSLKKVDSRILYSSSDETDANKTNATIYLSGKLACYLDEHNQYPSLPVIHAPGFIIDGKRYDSINEYAKEAKRQEQLRREAEERERREKARREREEAERRAAEARKREERERLQGEIDALTAERDSLKGIFAGMKRKKLQKQIDDLNERLGRL